MKLPCNLLPRTIVLSFILIALNSGKDAFAQTTGYSGTGANIDVKYHRFQWTLDPSVGKNIAGTVTTYFETKQNNVSQVTFDFDKSAFNNASLIVRYHGSTTGVSFSFPASGNVNILRINLPVVLPNNTLDSLSISYSGTPPSFATYGEGMDRSTTITGLGPTVYTLAESYGDDDFWPCKADMQDKIDSVDFIITTPSAYRAAANGALISDVVSAPNRIMTYKHRYPIPSYLIAVAVAQYNVYNRTPVTIGGKSVPVTYYIGSGRTPTAGNLTTMDRCRDELVAFSNVFGDYPFKNEKYGMYEFGWGGGMEHQTFSAMSWSSMLSWSVIAHELAHQWFGDKVTFSTWNHLWLAEGFARYSEALAAELVPALGQNAATVRSGFRTAARNTTNRAYAAYIPDSYIANSDLIWGTPYGSTVYERGAMIVSMLRTLAGDNLFYQACRNYLNDPALAYRSATTDDLRIHFQNILGGKDLTPFFDSYVMNGGYPTYSINWGRNGNQLVVQVASQTQTSPPVAGFYYKTPIALRVQGSLAGQDTVVVIYDENGTLYNAGAGILKTVSGNTISTTLSFTPTTVTFDPYFQTLAGGTVSFLAILDTKVVDFALNEKGFSNELNLSVTTAAEDNIVVTLQRSKDGVTFFNAGEMIKSTGTNTMANFSYTDNNPFESGTFYKAKITGPGYEKYSKVLHSKKGLVTGVSVYPNPATKDVFIKWSGTGGELAVISTDGQVVKKIRSSSGSATVSVAELPAGLYIVELRKEGVLVSRQKLVVKR